MEPPPQRLRGPMAQATPSGCGRMRRTQHCCLRLSHYPIQRPISLNFLKIKLKTITSHYMRKRKL